MKVMGGNGVWRLWGYRDGNYGSRVMRSSCGMKITGGMGMGGMEVMK